MNSPSLSKSQNIRIIVMMVNSNDPFLQKATKLFSRLEGIGFIVGFDEAFRAEWLEKGVSVEEIGKLLQLMKQVDEMTQNPREKEDVILYWREFIADACKQHPFMSVRGLLAEYLDDCVDKPLQDPFQLLTKVGNLECIQLLSKYLDAENAEVSRNAKEAIYDILYNIAWEKGELCSAQFDDLLKH